MAVPADAVWEVLADARSYADWVVGAKEVRSVADRWPEPGSHFDHTVGVGPFTIDDNTKSLMSEPPNRLVMEARGRPLGRARIEMLMEGSGSSTEVTMTEHIVSPAVMRWLHPLLGPLIRARNTESLRRLAALAAPDAP
jgi:uncharacterized protein YndB with AHSA1/START domain